jgi:hypothetical protein
LKQRRVSDRSAGESLLHYACLNNGVNMPLFVTFLMENGVDPDILNKRQAKCWSFLTEDKKLSLQSYIDSSHFEEVQGNQPSPFDQKEVFSPSEIEYEHEEEDNDKQMLRVRTVLHIVLALSTWDRSF